MAVAELEGPASDLWTPDQQRIWTPPDHLIRRTDCPLNIAMVVPAFVKTPPEAYGGTEAFAAVLAEYLIKIGHHVTIYACAGSHVEGATIVPISDGPLKESPTVSGDYARPVKDSECSLRAALRIMQTKPDVVINNYGFVYASQHRLLDPDSNIPVLTPMHQNLYGEAADQHYYTELGMPLISISDQQRRDAKGLPWFGQTIIHGIKLNDYPFNPNPDSGDDAHAVCITRGDMSKSPHIAALAAARAGMKIVMVVKTEDTLACKEYMRTKLMPVAEEYPDLIKLMKEQARGNVARIIGRAIVAVHTMGDKFHEPLGLVLEEYAAAGVPVVAQRRGSIPQVVIDGETGLIVEDMRDKDHEEELIESIVQALPLAGDLSRVACNQHAQEHFPHELMGWKYNKAMSLVLAA